MKYVAFLRAINVGGHAIIKMADLQKRFESAGMEHVQTYIQSGNVIFESEEDLQTLTTRIEHQLENAATYRIELFVRTMREVQSITRNSPFDVHDDETVFVTFLHKKLTRAQQETLLSLTGDADEFNTRGREIYHVRRDREKSILAKKSLEKFLNVCSTTRKITTLQKLVEKYK